jgi:hypothetical protein
MYKFIFELPVNNKENALNALKHDMAEHLGKSSKRIFFMVTRRDRLDSRRAKQKKTRSANSPRKKKERARKAAQAAQAAGGTD